MARPQLEGGYTRIANEILEQVMKVTLNGTQHRILLAVWRFTYGFQRKEHTMSIRFIASLINASRSQVGRELDVLIERNILKAVGGGPRKTRVISFNKRYDEWTSSIPNKINNFKKDAAPPAPRNKKAHHKKKKVYEKTDTYYKMAKYFHDKVSAVAEAEGLNHLIIKADLQKWSDEMRKLVEIDKVASMDNKEDRKMMSEVMDWVTADPFWKVNVLSAKKFREKFPELALKMKSSQKPKQYKQPLDPRDKELEFQRWVQGGNNPDDFNWS